MKKCIFFIILGCLPLLLTCTIKTVHNNEDYDPFTYPVEDGTWWIHQLYNLDTQKTTYDESYIRFIYNGTYEHPYAGTLQRLEYQNFSTPQQNWILTQTLFVQATGDSVILYFDDTENFHYMLPIPVEVGDGWQVNADITAKLVGRGDLFVNHKFYVNCLKIEYSDSLNSGFFWLPTNVGGLGVRMSTTTLDLLCGIQNVLDYDEAMLHQSGPPSPEL
jgi:hypothetical protein